jgi:hypothetical protein
VQRKRPGTLPKTSARRSRAGAIISVTSASTRSPHRYDRQLRRQAPKRRKILGRKLEAVSERTANLDMIRFATCSKSAIDDGYMRELPQIKMLDEAPPPKRDLVTPAEFDRLIYEARETHAKKMANSWRIICAFSRSAARAKKKLCASNGRT